MGTLTSPLVFHHIFPNSIASTSLSPLSSTLSASNRFSALFPSGGPHKHTHSPRCQWRRRRRRRRGFSVACLSAAELQPSTALEKRGAEISAELKGTSIFLVGQNCTLKTNLGKALADALRYYYFDSDDLVVQASGVGTDAASLRKEDESGFRDSETEVLKQLSSMGRLVVCAGDGAVQSVTNLAYLRYGISIWVDVPLDIVADEVLKNRTSTSSRVEVLNRVTKRNEELKEGYASADANISPQRIASAFGYDSLDKVTPEDMALEVLKQIEKLTRVKKMMEEAAKPF